MVCLVGANRSFAVMQWCRVLVLFVLWCGHSAPHCQCSGRPKVARVPSSPHTPPHALRSGTAPNRTFAHSTGSNGPILRNEWIGDGHLQFTFDLLNGIFMNELDVKTGNLESIAFSPFSIQSVLMMIHLGAKGVTKSEIAKVLHLEWTDNNATFSKSHEAFGQAVRSLVDDPLVSVSLHSSNQIFVQQDLPIAPTYSLALAHYHMSSIKYVNFAQDSYSVLNLINDWIEKHTQHLITNFLTTPPSPATSLVAVNAVRFKADWQYRFDPADTEPNAWFRMINGHTAKVEMMVAQLPVAYAYNQALQTSIIELPFKSSRLSFFILLPDDTFGLFSLLGSLNATVFANLIYSMRKVNGADKSGVAGVNIRLPKFTINSMPRITNILRTQLGLNSLFANEDANLAAMFSRPLSLVHMDELLHKAILKVDETGSTAAAVSSSSIERVGTFNGPYFECVHPFVYLLMDKQTGLALFAGFYAGPNNESKSQLNYNNKGNADQPNSNVNNIQGNAKTGQTYVYNLSKNERKNDNTS